MTSNDELLAQSDENFSLEYNGVLVENGRVELNDDNSDRAGLDQETLFAISMAHWSSRPLIFTKNMLRGLKRLDTLLRATKKLSVKDLKEIGDAQGFVAYWDRMKHDINSLGLDRKDAEAGELAMFAIVLRTLQSVLHSPEWSRLKHDIMKRNGYGYLLERAVEWDQSETVELLLVSGADPLHSGIGNIYSSREGKVTKIKLSVMSHLFLRLLPISHYMVAFKVPRPFDSWVKTTVDPRLVRENNDPFANSTNSGDPEITWIHVPRNNILMMMAIIRTFKWDTAYAFGKTFEALTRGSGDPLLTYLEPSFQSKAEYLTIVFPYLVLTTVEQQKAKRESQENLKRDLGYNEELLSFHHLERTLDEAYYPGLSHEVLDTRNHDQVVSHSTANFDSYNGRENDYRNIDPRALILMVPQLWLYKSDSVVISAYSMGQGTKYALDEHWSNYLFEGDDEAKSADMHLGFIITSFIDRFGKSYQDDDDYVDDDYANYPPPLDLFETRVVQLLSEVMKYIEQPSGGKSSSSGLEYRRERYFIHVISDVRSELAMIQHVLEQQERILKQFLKDCLPASEKQHLPDWAPIEASQETIQQYMRRVKKIDGDADRIEKSIQDMLNLKRTHASIRDAHSSLIVSTAVIGFTVVTIVFTPLAFLTALFALKVDGFESLQISGSDGVFHSGKIGGIFLSTEILTLALTAIAVWSAFKYMNRDEEHSWKEIVVGKAVEKAFGWVCALLRGNEIAGTWFKSLIAKLKNPSSRARAKNSDVETPAQDERIEEIVGPPRQNEFVAAPPVVSTG